MSQTKISGPVTLEAIAHLIVDGVKNSIKAADLATREDVRTIVGEIVKDEVDELARMTAIGFKATDKLISELAHDVHDFKETLVNHDQRLRRAEKRLQIA